MHGRYLLVFQKYKKIRRLGMREFVLQYLLGLRKDLSKFNNNLIIDNKDEILIELRIKRLLIAGNS